MILGLAQQASRRVAGLKDEVPLTIETSYLFFEKPLHLMSDVIKHPPEGGFYCDWRLTGHPPPPRDMQDVYRKQSTRRGRTQFYGLIDGRTGVGRPVDAEHDNPVGSDPLQRTPSQARRSHSWTFTRVKVTTRFSQPASVI
jgi:hypothetical protein